MKRFFSLFLAFIMLFTFAGCQIQDKVGTVKSYVTQIKNYLFSQTDWDNEPAVELVDIGGKTKYYFNQLTNREKHAYNNILSGVDTLPERIEIPEMDSDALTTVYEALLFDNPLLLQLGRTCNIISIGSRSYFSTDYVLTAESFTVQKQKLVAAAEKIIGGMADGMSDYEKEFYIHDYIIDNCSYKHDGGQGGM